MGITKEREAKQRVRDLVIQVKHEIGLEKPPCYLGVDDPVAAHLKVVVREQTISFGDGGQYLPRNPPEIVIDLTTGSRERLNFTFFHEISHHLIREDDELYGFLHDHCPEDLRPTLEHYCNIGAAEFLVPADSVRRIIQERGFAIELINHLDEVFPASKPAIAIQLAQCAAHSCVVVVCEYGVTPRQNRGQAYFANIRDSTRPQLYVRYSSGSPAYKYNTGRFIPIPKGHIIASAYEAQGLVKGRGNIPIRSGKAWPNDCEAYYYQGSVYAVFNVTSPPSPNQMAFSFR